MSVKTKDYLTPHFETVPKSVINESHLCGHIFLAVSTVTLARASLTKVGS